MRVFHKILFFLSLLVCFASVSCRDGGQAAKAGREAWLLVGNGAEPKSLDPHVVTGVVESNIIRALFEGLCADHPSENSTSLPGAAERWQSNEDFTKWTFYLRPKGLWSDGVPLTAHDFVFSFHRILHPDLAAPYASMLYYIKGAEDFNRSKLKDFTEVGVKAVDDYTLVVDLREPVPFLPSVTRHFTWFPVPRHIIGKYGSGDFTDDKNPWNKAGNIVTNGAFRLLEWHLGRHIVVEKSPTYWDHDNVRLQGIRFLPIEDPYTETRAFLAGQLHTTYKLPPDLHQVAEKKHLDYLREESYIGTIFCRLNTSQKPLDDPRVRQALSLSINRKLLCDYVYRGYEPTTGLTPSMQGYPAIEGVRFDPEKARKLLAEAGYPEGKNFPVFKLLISSSKSKSSAEVLQGMWLEHLGIRMQIVQLDWSSYVTAQQSLEYDLALAGWIGDYLDPSTFLNLWISGDGNNNTAWGSEDYDALLRAAAAGTEEEARFAGYKKAEELFLKELPVIPLAWMARVYLHRPEVKGWHPLLLDNHPWKSVWLDYD